MGAWWPCSCSFNIKTIGYLPQKKIPYLANSKRDADERSGLNCALNNRGEWCFLSRHYQLRSSILLAATILDTLSQYHKERIEKQKLVNYYDQTFLIVFLKLKANVESLHITNN